MKYWYILKYFYGLYRDAKKTSQELVYAKKTIKEQADFLAKLQISLIKVRDICND